MSGKYGKITKEINCYDAYDENFYVERDRNYRKKAMVKNRERDLKSDLNDRVGSRSGGKGI